MRQEEQLRMTIKGSAGFIAWLEGGRMVIAANPDKQQQIESVLTHAGISFQPFTDKEVDAPYLPGFRVMYTTGQDIDKAIAHIEELFEQYELEPPTFIYSIGEGKQLHFYTGYKPGVEDRYFVTFGTLPEALSEDQLTAYAAAL